MTRDRSVEGRISDWLQAEAPDRLPDRVLEATFERTRAVRRPAILGWRLPPMRRLPLAIAAGATAIALLVLAINLMGPPNRSVGSGPTPTPTATPNPTASPEPSPLPSATLVPVSLTGQIAFEATVDGNTDIYLMNLDRTGLVRLTDDPARDAAPSWSADGTQIVFTRGAGSARDVYVMAADGSGETRLTDSPEGEDTAAFSPDGTEIVFLRYVDETYFDLWLMAADGSNERLLWHQDDTFAGDPAWSPDGSTIFFNLDVSDGGDIDIARLDVATGEMTLIVDDPGDDSGLALSRDGSTIAFQSDRTPGGLFVADADGSNARHVTGSWTKGFRVSWSPDGEHLVYSLDDGWLYLVAISGEEEPIAWTQGGLDVEWRPTP